MLKYIFVCLFILTSFTYSSTISVPSDYPTIQGAIDFATEGDTVLVLPGIYYENISFVGENIVLASRYLETSDSSFITSTIIDGSQLSQGDSLGSVIRIFSGETTSTEIIGFTIQNGKGVKSGSSSLIGRRGGGVLVENSGVTLLNNIIINNSAATKNYSKGGAICLMYSPAIISNNRIENNISRGSNYGYGGGIYSKGIVELVIRNNIINNNVGDGIMLFGSVGIIDSNTIAFNEGRGVWAQSTERVVSNNNIHGNTDYGIAVNYGQLYIDRNIIANNGGGISSRASEMDITSNTIVKNFGPAVYKFWHAGRDIFFNNNIAWGNNNNGYQIVLEEAVTLTALYNDIQGGENSIFAGPAVVFKEMVGNISLCPSFCDFINDDFHLYNFSPCINAGSGGNTIGALGIGCSEIRGDANSDSLVNINDVEYLRAAYFDCGPTPNLIQTIDFNCNYMVDLVDLMMLIRYVNGDTTNSCCF